MTNDVKNDEEKEAKRGFVPINLKKNLIKCVEMADSSSKIDIIHKFSDNTYYTRIVPHIFNYSAASHVHSRTIRFSFRRNRHWHVTGTYKFYLSNFQKKIANAITLIKPSPKSEPLPSTRTPAGRNS